MQQQPHEEQNFLGNDTQQVASSVTTTTTTTTTTLVTTATEGNDPLRLMLLPTPPQGPTGQQQQQQQQLALEKATNKNNNNKTEQQLQRKRRRRSNSKSHQQQEQEQESSTEMVPLSKQHAQPQQQKGDKATFTTIAATVGTNRSQQKSKGKEPDNNAAWIAPTFKQEQESQESQEHHPKLDLWPWTFRQKLPPTQQLKTNATLFQTQHHGKHTDGQLATNRLFSSSTTPSTATTTTMTTAPASSVPGLFSIPEFQTPQDFDTQTQLAKDTCQRLRLQLQQVVQQIHSKQKHDNDGDQLSSFRCILQILDDMSKAVCHVIDAAELVRNIHAQPLWRKYAQEAFAKTAQYISELNADPFLHQALLHCFEQDNNEHANTTRSNVPLAFFTEEEGRLAISLRAEFERNGIHLSQQQRQNVVALQSRITSLETAFMNNLTLTHQHHKQHHRDGDDHHAKEGNHHDDPHYIWVNAAEVYAVIPQNVLQAHGVSRTRGCGTQQGGEEQELALPRHDTQILQTLLRFSPCPTLRQSVYMAYATQYARNVALLEELRTYRHALATALGFPSFAHYVLQDQTMANHPDKVSSFLKQLAADNRTPYQQDLDRLRDIKQKHLQMIQQQQPNDDASSSNTTTTVVVEPWDVNFYIQVARARRGFDVAAISEYLTLEHSLNSMKTLVNNLFGIRMQEQTTLTTWEQWDIQSSAEKADADGRRDSFSKIRKFHFETVDGHQPLGTMYLDLEPRPGKYSHAAHFTVRCGCILSTSNDNDNESRGTDDEVYQLPVVALVCNFSPMGPTRRLQHSEVETLFHEFGHGLHSLLSRTRFQHLSGTRAAMDFVETPSHVMEHYVWDTEFLKNVLCVHHQTGDPIPDELIKQLQLSKDDFQALERQNQILYAMTDQVLFGVPASQTTSTTEGTAGADETTKNGKGNVNNVVIMTPSSKVYADLHEQLEIPYAPGTHGHARLGHLVTYGATYYSYLFAQVFAKNIWKECLEKDQQSPTSQQEAASSSSSSMDRSAGDALWHKMLIHGGARDPVAMLTELLGRPPQI